MNECGVSGFPQEAAGMNFGVRSFVRKVGSEHKVVQHRTVMGSKQTPNEPKKSLEFLGINLKFLNILGSVL